MLFAEILRFFKEYRKRFRRFGRSLREETLRFFGAKQGCALVHRRFVTLLLVLLLLLVACSAADRRPKEGSTSQEGSTTKAQMAQTKSASDSAATTLQESGSAQEESSSEGASPTSSEPPSPTATSTQTAAPSTSILPGKMTIYLMGDISFGSSFGQKKRFEDLWQKNGSAYFMEGVQAILDQGDLNIANLENVFTERTAYRKGKIYTYKAYRPEYLEILKAGKIDYVNVVNNHMGDYLQEGFDDTLAYLKEYGIEYFGTNLKDCASAEIGSVKVNRVQIFEKNGISVGMMGYLGYSSSYPSDETIVDNIEKLRAQGVDYIIASLHAGGQESPELTSKQISIAKKLIDLGADMVYGHHPHVLQRVEEYQGKRIYYSLGNFLFIAYGAAKDPYTAMVELTLHKDEKGRITESWKTIPVLWTGAFGRNEYRPLFSEDPAVRDKVLKKLWLAE